MLFSPVHQREWVLPYYLRNIYDLNYDKKLIHILWVINNTTDNSMAILEKFRQVYGSEYGSISIQIWENPKVGKDERTTEQRGSKGYEWLAELRNRGVYECLKGGYDYLFSVDSDVLLPPEVLNNLISKQKKYVSALLYNGYEHSPDKPEKYPNVLRTFDDGRTYLHTLNNYTKNKKGIIRCDFTGAVFICEKSALPYLKFANDPLGEDLPACRSLQKNGIDPYCSCDDYCQHIMGRKFLEQFKNFPNY